MKTKLISWVWFTPTVIVCVDVPSFAGESFFVSAAIAGRERGAVLIYGPATRLGTRLLGAFGGQAAEVQSVRKAPTASCWASAIALELIVRLLLASIAVVARQMTSAA